jgi:hypothetical protein
LAVLSSLDRTIRGQRLKKPLGLRVTKIQNVVCVCEAAGEVHAQHVNGGHLRREHAFELIPWLYAFDYGDHKVKRHLVHLPALRRCPGKLRHDSR